MCELIAVETNRYALQNGVSDWVSVSASELWTFFGTVVLMGIPKLLEQRLAPRYPFLAATHVSELILVAVE